MSTETRFMHDAAQAVDPLGDAEKEADKGTKHNRAKVGSGRPSSLLYTYGPGAIMDLPQFTVMPAGLDDWDRIWHRRDGIPQIRAPRLREVVGRMLNSRDIQLRPHPWQPKKFSMSSEGNDLGVPARVFPQWLRCTGCDMLGLLSQFDYRNTHPYRTDLACFEHSKCTGRGGDKARKPARRTAVPARYLLACQRPSRRIPIRPLGTPRKTLCAGTVPGVEDDRPNCWKGRLGDDHLRVMWPAQVDE